MKMPRFSKNALDRISVKAYSYVTARLQELGGIFKMSHQDPDDSSELRELRGRLDSIINRNIDRNVRAGEAIADAAIALRGAPPWVELARMTALRADPKQVWSRARESKIACASASARQWREIRDAGEWEKSPRFFGRRIHAWLCVRRLYLAAALYRVHCAGILDLAKDQAFLTDWCKPSTCP